MLRDVLMGIPSVAKFAAAARNDSAAPRPIDKCELELERCGGGSWGDTGFGL